MLDDIGYRVGDLCIRELKITTFCRHQPCFTLKTFDGFADQQIHTLRKTRSPCCFVAEFRCSTHAGFVAYYTGFIVNCCAVIEIIGGQGIAETQLKMKVAEF